MRGDKPSPSGFVLVEAAKTTKPDIYDWDNKISFAMTEGDMAEFIVGIKTGCKIFHKYGEANKTLELRIGNSIEDRRNDWIKPRPSWMLTLSSYKDGESNSATLPVSASEMAVLDSLMRAAIPLIRGWDSEEEPWEGKG